MTAKNRNPSATAAPPRPGGGPPRPAAPARWRAAWKSAHAPVPGVPRWAHVAALAVPFAVLPSGLWRLGPLVPGLAEGAGSGDLPSWLPLPLYVLLLTLLSEALAFTAVGLIASWGERYPRWVPVLRGRRVPTAAAVVPGALGAMTLTLMFTVLIPLTELSGKKLSGEPQPADYPGDAGGWSEAVFHLCYAPLVLWGPLLGAVTYAYWRRRTDGTGAETKARTETDAGAGVP